MEKIVVLGPSGTFSEKALYTYMENKKVNLLPIYKSTLEQVLTTVNDKDVMGIIPIENTLDGFLGLVLDKLLEYDLQIIDELVLPVNYSYVSNYSIEEVEKIYVQFKAKPQCDKFLHNKSCIITSSNIESLNLLNDSNEKYGAVIPIDIDSKFSIKVNHIEDNQDNRTRFVIIRKQSHNFTCQENIKVSCCICPTADKPGVLVDVLNVFCKMGINLNFIMSRPNKNNLGKYYFFIDFLVKNKEEIYELNQVMNKKKNEYIFKLFGVYERNDYYENGRFN